MCNTYNLFEVKYHQINSIRIYINYPVKWVKQKWIKENN